MRERLVFDEELDFEAGQQDFVEHPDDQFVLTNGEAPHRTASEVGASADDESIGSSRTLYARRPGGRAGRVWGLWVPRAVNIIACLVLGGGWAQAATQPPCAACIALAIDST